MKDGEMRGVDLVPTKHVGRQEPLLVTGRECRDFVSRGVGPEHDIAVDVVRVGRASSWVIRDEAEVIEVLLRADDGTGRR